MKENSPKLNFENNSILKQEGAAHVQPFGGVSPASEVLLVVKQPKQVQLQDVFNILLSISDLFPPSLDYTSQKVLLCYSHTVCLLF